MSQESRVRKSLLNARVNLIFYFLTLALSFFSRKIFLDTLGADFVGLTGTLQNLLGFLNLAEFCLFFRRPQGRISLPLPTYLSFR